MQQRPWEEYGGPAEAPAPVITRRADPRLDAQTRVAEAEADAARYAEARARAEAAKAEADARIAEANAQRGGTAPPSAETQDTRSARLSALTALTNQLRAVRFRYDRDLAGGPSITSPLEYLPLPTNRAFDSAAAGLENPFLAAFRVPGVGSQSDAELRSFIRGNVPSASDSDETIEQKLANIENRIQSEIQARGLRIPGPAAAPPAAPAAAPREIMDQSGPVIGGAAPPAAPAELSQRTRTVVDPSLRAIGGRVGQMLARGRPDAEILDYMRGAGIPPESTSIGAALSHRRTPQWRAWQQQHPGAPYPLGERFYTREVPLSAAEQGFNAVAQSPVGAYAISAGEGLTGNRLDDLTDLAGGNGEQIRRGEDLLRAQRPVSSVAGDISGQALFEALAGRVPGGRALLATRWGRRGADAAYGAYAGSGSGEGTDVLGGVTGTVANTFGGMAGRGLQRGAGAALTGVRDPALQYLHQRGVPMTLGQMARVRAAQSIPARMVAGAEDRLTGLSGPGDIINAARRRGFEGYNRAAFNEGLEPIGQNIGPATGGEAIDTMQTLVSGPGGAYDRALGGVTVPRDPQFTADYATARIAGEAIPVHGPQIGHALDQALDPRLATAPLSGEEVQAAIQGLRQEAATYRGQPGGNAAQGAFRNVETALTDLVGRQSPGTMPALNAANRAYRLQQIIQRAVRGAGSNDELITPAQLRNASIANTTTYGGANQAASTTRPFYDLTRYGQQVLPSQVPDSGTAGRAMLGQGLLASTGASIGGVRGYAGADEGGGAGGAAEGAAEGALLATALASPYTRTGQQALQTLLLGQRFRQIAQMGDYLIANPRRTGQVGSGLARDLALYGELQPQ